MTDCNGASHIGDHARDFSRARADTARHSGAHAVELNRDGQLLAAQRLRIEVRRRAEQRLAVVRRLQLQLVFEQFAQALGARQLGKHQRGLPHQFGQAIALDSDGTRGKRSAAHANTLRENGLVTATGSQWLAILRGDRCART
ncbi:hypothetical protein FQZ97_897800 [compost metagenome]